ncbi:MAG TPA: translation elongation factor EF-1 subunit alpha [Candidatus Woesearchaeota archaeon]|nr:translation elongation factor EF-1 subunit alpha [Candidatus Woesearchaeota archaeon]
MASAKEHINLVFIGHIDHGKSTTVGRLLFDSGNVEEQKLRKLREEAERIGKKGFEFAFVMDSLKEERERGITIDLAHQKFETDKYYFTVIDAPGHRDFVKNMITGASQADAAVLVVAADDGVNAQTKEHIFLARTLGVKQIIIAINKMDKVKYDQAKFNAVKEDVSKVLKSIGFKPDQIPFVAISSLMGDNVAKKSENMSWYTGKTLLETIDSLSVPEKPTQLPLRVPIQDVFSITGIGVVPVGRVETGVMKVGDKIIAVPGREGRGVLGECKTIEMHHESMKQAGPGDNIGFNVRGFGSKDVARGDVIGHPDNPPTLADEFTAQIVVLNHPSAMTVGYTPVFHVHTSQVTCTFTEFVKKLNPATGETLEENPTTLKNGDAAIVKIKPRRPLVIEKQKDIPQMSRFAVRDSGVTVSAGMCIDLVKKELEKGK